MNAIRILAGLTLKEAFRRRTWIAALVITGLFLLVWLATHTLIQRFGERPETAQNLTQLGLAMMRFYAALIGMTLAAGAITGEIERGTHYVVLARPLGRAQFLLGKWVGILLACLCLYLLWGALVILIARLDSPETLLPFLHAAAIGFLYPALFATLTLAFSTLAPPLLASALGLITLVIGWAQEPLRHWGDWVGQGEETDHLLHWLSDAAGTYAPIAGLERAQLVALGMETRIGGLATRMALPFGERLHFVVWDVAWPALYLGLVLALALLIFRRRDV